MISNGTAIGTKFAPPYACLVMDKIETAFLDSEQEKPLLWLRYIDDIFFIWNHGERKLLSFLEWLNNFDSNFKFTYNHSPEQINFLDVSVYLKNGKIETDIFVKPTDCHQYLHVTSCHPYHTKKSIVYSQGLRLRRICSDNEKFFEHLEQLSSWFEKRGYPKSLIDSQLDQVKAKNREELLIKKSRSTSDTFFMVTYSPSLANIGPILKKYLHIYEDQLVKKKLN